MIEDVRKQDEIMVVTFPKLFIPEICDQISQIFFKIILVEIKL